MSLGIEELVKNMVAKNATDVRTEVTLSLADKNANKIAFAQKRKVLAELADGINKGFEQSNSKNRVQYADESVYEEDTPYAQLFFFNEYLDERKEIVGLNVPSLRFELDENTAEVIVKERTSIYPKPLIESEKMNISELKENVIQEKTVEFLEELVNEKA